MTRVQNELPDLRRYRLVLIDESHNLRNRDGKRYRVIRDYIQRNDSRCILLTATPYNKTYLDLSNQLRLFLDDQADLGIRPEALLREMDEVEFSRRYDASPRSIAAFEKSEPPRRLARPHAPLPRPPYAVVRQVELRPRRVPGLRRAP